SRDCTWPLPDVTSVDVIGFTGGVPTATPPLAAGPSNPAAAGPPADSPSSLVLSGTNASGTSTAFPVLVVTATAAWSESGTHPLMHGVAARTGAGSLPAQVTSRAKRPLVGTITTHAISAVAGSPRLADSA